MTPPPTGQQLVRTGVTAVVIVSVIGLLLVLTPLLELRDALVLLAAYAVAVAIVTCGRWLQGRAGRD